MKIQTLSTTLLAQYLPTMQTNNKIVPIDIVFGDDKIVICFYVIYLN